MDKKTVKNFAKQHVTKKQAAIEKMVGHIATSGKISHLAARYVFELYKKEKALKYDAFNGIYSVKHGAYFEESTIETALRIINGVV